VTPLYGNDLAWLQARAFGGYAVAAAPHVIARLRAARNGVRHVVEIGCGAGPLTAALCEAGFAVTAVDPSPALLALARDAAPRAEFAGASAYDYELPPCDAVIALGEPLTYHEDAAAADSLVRGFLQRAARVLPSGGPLLFDLIETGAPPLDARFHRSADDYALLVATTEDTAARTLTREIELFRREGERYRRTRELHRVRLFETAEVLAWLDTAGFDCETVTAWGADSLPPRRCVFLAARR